MSDGSKNTNHGITFIGALQVLFIGLKLAGFIDWPWWQVLLPVIIEVAIIAVCLVLLGVVAYKEYKESR